MFRVRISPALRPLAACCLLLVAAPALPQEASAADLGSIEKALLRIAEVLDRQSRQTHTSLLLSRLEIENRDLRALDESVSTNRTSLRQLDFEERGLIEMIDRERDRIERETESQDERLQLLRELESAETQLERLRSDRSDLELRVIELENEAQDATLRRDALRAEIDQLLGVDPR